jgi:hypothetical protein
LLRGGREAKEYAVSGPGEQRPMKPKRKGKDKNAKSKRPDSKTT